MRATCSAVVGQLGDRAHGGARREPREQHRERDPGQREHAAAPSAACRARGRPRSAAARRSIASRRRAAADVARARARRRSAGRRRTAPCAPSATALQLLVVVERRRERLAGRAVAPADARHEGGRRLRSAGRRERSIRRPRLPDGPARTAPSRDLVAQRVVDLRRAACRARPSTRAREPSTTTTATAAPQDSASRRRKLTARAGRSRRRAPSGSAAARPSLRRR